MPIQLLEKIKKVKDTNIKTKMKKYYGVLARAHNILNLTIDPLSMRINRDRNLFLK